MMATTSTVPAPETLWATIPPELKSTASWVCWRYGERGDDGRPKKVPVDANEGTPAKVNNPATWATFDAAVAGVSRWGADGIGFVFGPDDPFAGIDLDDAGDDAALQAAHRGIVEAFPSYTEFSPSGRGLHIIVRGSIQGARKHGVEAYSTGRFFTMTGNVYRDLPIITPEKELMAELQADLAPARTAHTFLSTVPETALDHVIVARMCAAANGEKARRLANGDASALDGSDLSGSAVDMALVNIIAFYTKCVPQIERIWLDSPHGQNPARRKKLDRVDYRMRTIRQAFDRELPAVDFSALNVVRIEPYLAGVAERARQPATLPPPVGTLIVDGVAEPRPGGVGQAVAAPAAAVLLTPPGTALDAAECPEFHASAGTGPGAAPGGFLAAAGGDAHSAATGAGAQPQAVPMAAALPPVGMMGTAPAAARLPVATLWACLDPAALPPRHFLHARHYIRGVVSTTIAPGGTCKSQLAITDAIAMTAGRDLIGNQPTGQLTVWYVNLEDGRDELNRRIAATLLRYGLEPNDLGGRLYVDSGRETPLVIAKAVRDGADIHRDVCSALVHEMASKGVDALIIDPFISSHQVSENDNNAIDTVVKAWAAIAGACNCAVELIHHARKGNGNETTVDDGRGASALIGAVRSARVLNRMSDKEAAKCGIAPGERAEYVRVNIVKSNLARSTACPQWFRMASHALPNGDDVGIVEGWKWPAVVASSEFDEADRIAVQAIVGSGNYKLKRTSGQEWVGLHIAPVFGLDHIATNETAKNRMVKIIDMLIAEGVIKAVRKKDRNSAERSFVEVGTPIVAINLQGISAPSSVPSFGHQSLIDD